MTRAESRLGHERTVHAHDREHHEQDDDGSRRTHGGDEQPPHAIGDERPPTTAVALHAGPVQVPARATEDEEQRHDLDEPARARESVPPLERVPDDEASPDDPDTDHRGVQHDHDEQAPRPCHVDREVTIVANAW